MSATTKSEEVVFEDEEDFQDEDIWAELNETVIKAMKKCNDFNKDQQEQWDELHEKVIKAIKKCIDFNEVRDDLDTEDLDYEADELQLPYFQGILVRLFKDEPYDGDDKHVSMSSLEELVQDQFENCFHNHIETHLSDIDSAVGKKFIEMLKQIYAVEIYEHYRFAFGYIPVPLPPLKRTREEINTTTTTHKKIKV